MGVGGGLRLRLLKNSYLRLDWAKRIGDDAASGAGPATFYLTLQWEM